MLIYSAVKEEFLNDVRSHSILNKLEEEFSKKIGKVTPSEKRSWEDSMKEMFMLLSDTQIPNDAGVAVEFKIPMTSNRIDFMISGYDDKGNSSVIVIELKGWQEAYTCENKDGLVEKVVTYLGKGMRETTHPSYQAWSYSELIHNFNESVQQNNITVFPCAYLYRFEKAFESQIKSQQYKYYIEKSPVYMKEDTLELSNYIKKIISKGDNKKNLIYIENGKLKPSKSLQDSLSSMLEGNQEFTMIDNQKIIYENALLHGKTSIDDNKKRVVIVEGGPGTGKSVVAINLLVNFNNNDILSQYISKNSAPRNVYSRKLTGKKKKTEIKMLFNGSGSYTETKENDIPVLIVDEAHRLNEKSGMFRNLGENQIKEVIKTAQCSIFFIDEDQKVDIHDIGSMEEIEKYSKEYGAEVFRYKLESQFRCSGSDGYLAWLDDVLGIRQTANFDGFNDNYEIKVFDSPNELRKAIEEKNSDNKARLVAGYCWNWIKDGKNNSGVYDIEIDNFKMSWNLGNSSTWAIDKDSVNEVGCIHTCQGLEFDYVGVIIGDDLRYENGTLITDFTKRAKTDQSLKGIKKLYKENPSKAEEVADKIIRNTYRTLMTRGQKGCYIYCTDEKLSQYFKERLHNNQELRRYPIEEYNQESRLGVAENKFNHKN